MMSLLPEARLRFVSRVLTGLAYLAACLALLMVFVGTARSAVAFGSVSLVLFALRFATRRRSSSVSLTTHAVAASLLAVTVGLAWVNGLGLAAPVMFVLPTVPLFVAFLAGWRPALGWTVACVIVPPIFLLARDSIPGGTFDPYTLDLLRIIAMIGSVVTVLAIAWSYENAVREQQEALEAARNTAEAGSLAKSAFLAAISHEIRTPLGGILGLSELLDHQDLPPDQAEKVRLIQSSGRTLLALVDDVLDFSRVEAGRLELERAPVDLRELSIEVAGLLGARAADRGVRIEVSHEGPQHVLGDALRLRQILLNLVANAIKFTEAGTVRLGSVARVDGDDVDVVLTVQDTGVGIAPEAQARLFEPFSQAESGIARRYGGSGLGLAIVRRLVDAMNGTIGVDSEVGVGTAFTVSVTFPASDPPAAPVAGPRDVAGTRVLLAEDNAVNQRVIVAMLRRLGCEVAVVPDGRQAVERALAGGWDVVLMDQQMPVMDGLSATRAMREAGLTVPVVALTANVTPEDRARCIEAGMNGFIAKPVPLAELAAALLEVRGSEPA